MVTIFILHVYLIPSFTQSYNYDCYLDKKSLKTLEFMLLTILEVFEKHNVEHWIDFGTLLGAFRYRGIIPWDGDGDVSFIRNDPNIHAALSELKSRGIEANTMIAKYDGMTIDFMRWYKDEGYYRGEKTILLYKYYPPWVEDNIIIKINHKLDSFPYKWIGKRTKLPFLSTKAYAPVEYSKLIKHRYSFTSWISMPYKWKCYVPCFLYNKDPSCR